jgi:isopenicillin-N epimerase
VREHWTLDPDVVYLNHGAFGAVPAVTQRAKQRLQDTVEANPMRWFRDLPLRLIRTREAVGRYLGVAAPDIAWVPNSTTGVNVALRSVASRPGQRYVLTNHAYGAVRVLVARIAAERGCTVDVVDVDLDASDETIVAALEASLDADGRGTVACLLVDQITSATAKMMPVERVAALGAVRGVPVVVDGAHAPGLVDEPVVGDFWTGNLHKWPCAPRGSAVLYVDPRRRSDVVPHTISWDDALGFPLAFDRPGTTDATGWIASITALQLLDTLRFADHRKRLGDLASAGAEIVADAIGGRPVSVGEPAPTMRLVALPGDLVGDDLEAARLGEFLAARAGVEVQVTTLAGRGFLRLSCHLYNTFDDYATAAARLAPLFTAFDRLQRVTRPG